MSSIPIALVIGDPNGIGPEIAVKAALQADPDSSRILLVGDRHVVGHYAGSRDLRVVDPTQLPAPVENCLDLVDVDGIANVDFRPGSCNAASGRATVKYIESAVALAKIGAVSAILACPHNETAVNAAGISFSGYPGLLAKLNGLPEERVFLMLIGGGLRIVHVTLHESLSGALDRLSASLVVAAAAAAKTALGVLGISAPRIGLCGIDPHAGENGLFGHADERITFPAAAKLRDDGFDIVGPLGADLLLAGRDCDAYVAMYHDQGHIPVKLLAGRNSSAFSIGAGVFFASVGHGSAPDIAGRDEADPDPVIRTLQLMVNAGAASDRVPAL